MKNYDTAYNAIRRAAIALLATFAAAAQTEPGPELTELQGDWTVAAAEQSGQPLDAIKGGVLTIMGDAFALRTAVGNHFDGKLTIDGTANPKAIDFLLSNGAVWEGIYTASAGILRLNYVERGDDSRPTVFATTADTRGTVIVLRKAAAEH